MVKKVRRELRSAPRHRANARTPVVWPAVSMVVGTETIGQGGLCALQWNERGRGPALLSNIVLIARHASVLGRVDSVHLRSGRNATGRV